MNPEDAIDFSREAIKTCMMVGGPILVASLLIGLIIGVIQAMTQVQDQAVSFVPKILLLTAVIGLCLPWLTDTMLDFAKTSFETPMTMHGISARPKQDYPSQDRTASLNSQSVEISTPATDNADTPTPPLPSPFVLPHFYFEKTPASDLGG